MNANDLLQAFAAVDPKMAAEAEQPVKRKAPVFLRAALSLAAVAAACAGIFFGMRWLGRQQGITYAPGYSDNIIESASTQTSTVTDETATTTEQTTASTACTSETVSQTATALTTTEAASRTQVTGSTAVQTTDTASTKQTTQTTTKPTDHTTTTKRSQTTAGTTQRTTESTTTTQADPEAVIQQLKTGYLHDFDWDATRERGEQVTTGLYCEVDCVPYGVAFLCRDSDLEALKSGKIGTYPVNWSEGAWTDTGGSGAGNVKGATKDNCLVQPVSGFVCQYGGGNALEMHGTGHTFSFRYDQQTQCRVMNDYSAYAQDGWTVCMASVEAEFCATAAGSAYRDYTALIRALAAKPETVLLGIVYGEELSFGGTEGIPELIVHVTGGQPALDALAAYGTVQEMQDSTYWYYFSNISFSSEYGWYLLVLSQEKMDEIYARLGPAPPDYPELGDWYAARMQETRALCGELMQIPGVRLAQPGMEYFA